MSKYLIVNADDFGLCPGVNRGIEEAHERGVVRSASFMVSQPGTREAVDYAQQHPSLDLGLHVDLGEWAHCDGEWKPLYERVNRENAEEAETEILRQVTRFEELLGRLPTHLDSHQHVHRQEPVRSIMCSLAGQIGVPLRHESSIRYCGDFYGQYETGEPDPTRITAEGLAAIVADVGFGATELCCHPGLSVEVRTVYAAERLLEVEALCSSIVAHAVASHGISLLSFREAST